MSAFEPFFNYDSLNEEMAADLRIALTEYKKAQDDLLEADEVGQQVNCAKLVVEKQNELMKTAKLINNEIYTIPVIVHEAGRVRKQKIKGEVVYVQRCRKCASELHISNDRDMAGWESGAQVAKTSKGSPSPMMYVIEDRETLDHEFECVSLKNIFKG
jgi:hypothetical protein